MNRAEADQTENIRGEERAVSDTWWVSRGAEVIGLKLADPETPPSVVSSASLVL